MPNRIRDSFQVNQYDKIIRENLEVTLQPQLRVPASSRPKERSLELYHIQNG